MCRDGLASLYERFRFTRDGQVTDIAEAFATHDRARVHHGRGRGHGRGVTELVIPYHGHDLSGPDLRHQLDVWVADGIVEPSFAHAIESVMAHPEWLDLTGVDFAVLGAGAEMGPLACLLDWGATVWAVDLPRPELWRRLITEAENRAGRLRIPVPIDGPDRTQLEGSALAAVAGADLLTQAPEIRTWLAGIGRPFTLGNYVYADGPLHVRVSLAIDAISMDLIAAGHDVMLAWLATPTDVFAAPIEAVEESRRRWRSAGLWRFGRAPLRMAGQFTENYPSTVFTCTGVEYGISDCLVGQQGPNYILAKRLQRWRAMAAREDGRPGVAQRGPEHSDQVRGEEQGPGRRLRRGRPLRPGDLRAGHVERHHGRAARPRPAQPGVHREPGRCRSRTRCSCSSTGRATAGCGARSTRRARCSASPPSPGCSSATPDTAAVGGCATFLKAGPPGTSRPQGSEGCARGGTVWTVPSTGTDQTPTRSAHTESHQ